MISKTEKLLKAIIVEYKRLKKKKMYSMSDKLRNILISEGFGFRESKNSILMIIPYSYSSEFSNIKYIKYI